MNTCDRKGRPLVAVTGLGIVTSLGRSKAENWAKLTSGQSGVGFIKRFTTEGLKAHIAGSIDFMLPAGFNSQELSYALAEDAAREALDEAGMNGANAFPGPLFIAVPPAEISWRTREDLAATLPAGSPVTYAAMIQKNFGKRRDILDAFSMGRVGDLIAQRFGTRGSPISISTACASGATAVQMGVDAIRFGLTNAALAIGTDGSINVESVIRFSLLSALSMHEDPPQEASRPFSHKRDGFVMAEGAAALVLENFDTARARGAEILGIVAGCGERADTFHRTRSNPDGSAIVGAINNALEDAGMGPDEIDYINAHGTSTPENDKMEALACMAVFGERMKALPISSNKSMIGHTLTAAGAVEAVISLLTIRHGVLPPTINYREPDPAIPFDVVPNIARAQKVNRVMSNSFGFGGQNVSLIFQSPP